MIGSILRLTSFGNQQSRWRIAGIVLGIAIGVGLLLTLLGAAQGLTARNERSAWLSATHIPIGESTNTELTDDSVLLARFFDYADGEAIARMDVASTASSTVRTPWDTPLPAPGTYYASPAMIDLIERLPPEQLGDRFGTLAGEIPASALESPDSIVILAGKTEAELRSMNQTVARPAIAGLPEQSNPVYRVIMIIGGIAMFIPVLLLISTTTQLGGAERAERLATLRLIGATPQSLTLAATLEMGAIALVGSLLGFAGWTALKPIGARFSIDEGRFYPSDLDLSLATILLVLVATVAATSIAAGLRIAKMDIGPLGASRERIEQAPSFVRVLPLIAGVGIFALITVVWQESSVDLVLLELAIIGGFVLTAGGLVSAGPWLTSMVSRLSGQLARSASGVIAAGRIRRHPQAVFRSVSGLVLAVFLVSVFAGSASSVLESDDPRDGEQVFPLTLVYVEPSASATESQLESLTSDLETIPGVTRAMIALIENEDASSWILPADVAPFANVNTAGSAPWVRFNGYEYMWGDPDTARPETTRLSELPESTPGMILVANDGRTGVVDEIRTALDRSGMVSALGSTRPDSRDMTTRDFVNSLATLAYIGIAVTIVIAGISLTVSTAVSMLERKRVFGLLRLMGMPNGAMNRIVTFEAVAPLVAVLALSIGTGFLIAWLMIEGLSYERSLHAPDARFYIAIAGSFVLAVASVLTITGLIRRNTQINQTRFE